MGAVRTKELLIAEVAEGTEARGGKEKAHEGPTVVGRLPAWLKPSGSRGTRSSGKSTWTSPTKAYASPTSPFVPLAFGGLR